MGTIQNSFYLWHFLFPDNIDDYSRVVWVYLLADKREVSTMLHNFFALLERQFHKQVKIFRSDNETKFTCMKRYFLDRGIIFQSMPCRWLFVTKFGVHLAAIYVGSCGDCGLAFCQLINVFGLLYQLSFLLQDNKDLYAEEAAAQRERERQRMLSIPGLIAPSELQDEMVDSQIG